MITPPGGALMTIHAPFFRIGRAGLRVAVGLWVTALVSVALSLLAGCGTTAPTAGTPAPPDTATPVFRPATSFRIASLDVGSFRGRIEQKQVDELASLISKHRVEVIAIQGLTRYPGVSTRTDLVDALGATTGMRTSFGETIAVSGRQSGNALLSAYPVASSDSRPYDGVSGTGFEGALQTIVDAGTRTVLIVSTRLPDPLSEKDLRICAGTLTGIADEYPDDPLIVLGNLPHPPAGDVWKTTAGEAAGRAFTWFTPRGMAVRDGGADLRCALGTVHISEVDVYPRGRP